jgi:single-strand DNA-binding protein
MSLNKVALIGHVGANPEITDVGGKKVANMSLATSETYTKNEERITNTEWHKLVLWGKLAELVEKHIKKGSQIYIEGKLKTRSWENTDGKKQYTTEIIVNEVKFLDKKEE